MFEYQNPEEYREVMETIGKEQEMSRIVSEIQTLIEEGMDWDQIATLYDVPYGWVVDCHNMLEEQMAQEYEDHLEYEGVITNGYHHEDPDQETQTFY